MDLIKKNIYLYINFFGYFGINMEIINIFLDILI